LGSNAFYAVCSRAPMSNSNKTETAPGVSGEVDHFVYRVPKKNHGAMLQLNKQFSDIIVNEYGVIHSVFQLNGTQESMEGITNIAKTVSAAQDEEVWLELLFYRDRKHKAEVGEKMRNEERMGPLWQQSVNLVSPGTNFIMGEFSRLNLDK
jgi:uncharacterized protein YbaA (DUF1428 family)